ncbi:hypothetical protein ACIA74_33805 [Streptomyces sp. NPDC051658]|uniref:hypothetical protein n=1 Tax=unclassified Streptomyces TaxID=2593676 RepID=UPI0037B73139|nr:hypothetical protein OG520_06885 [Streptomyces sp. NBC_00984]
MSCQDFFGLPRPRPASSPRGGATLLGHVPDRAGTRIAGRSTPGRALAAVAAPPAPAHGHVAHRAEVGVDPALTRRTW